MNPRHVLGLAAAASLALPAVAGAHPSVFSTTARIDTNPDPALVNLQDQAQYAVTNHGFTYVLRETNGETTGGVVNYREVPGGYRNQTGITAGVRWARITEGDTGAQAHATCRGVAELEDQAAIEAWQANHENPSGPIDPFYLYVPFQTASAGLEDDPAAWLAALEDLVGIVPSEIDTPAEATQACIDLGGTYEPADETATTFAALAAGTVEQAVTPLQTEITLLKGEAATLTANLNAMTAAKAAADTATGTAQADAAAARRELAALKAATPQATPRPLTLTLASRSMTGGKAIAMVTGPAGARASMRVLVSAADQKRLGLRSRAFITGTRTLGTSGASLLTLTAAKSTRDALRRAAKATPVTVEVKAGGETKTAKGTLR